MTSNKVSMADSFHKLTFCRCSYQILAAQSYMGSHGKGSQLTTGHLQFEQVRRLSALVVKAFSLASTIGTPKRLTCANYRWPVQPPHQYRGATEESGAG